MAFDSTTSVTLSLPTLSATIDDWVLTYTLPYPVLVSSLNDWSLNVSVSLPTLDATADFTKAYSLSATLSKPTLSARQEQSLVFQLSSSLKAPSVVFTVSNPISYTLNKTLQSVTLSSSFEPNGGYVLRATLKRPQVSFGVRITGDEAKQTWVLNVITGCHSRYTNYEFNSFFKIGTKQYGLKDTGLYEVTGATDFAGEVIQSQIDSEIHTPISDFGEQAMKVCDNAFLYMRSDGDMEVTCKMDEEEEREGYYIRHDNRNGMHRRRTPIPKGLKGNAWQYKIKNVDGSDFDINAFEVSLKTIQRVKW